MQPPAGTIFVVLGDPLRHAMVPHLRGNALPVRPLCEHPAAARIGYGFCRASVPERPSISPITTS